MTTEDYEFKTEAEARAFDLGVKLANNQDRVRVRLIEGKRDARGSVTWVVTLEILPASASHWDDGRRT